MTEFVTVGDIDDPRLRRFRLNERGLATRSDRRDDAGAGLFLAEGDLVVERALAAGCRPLAALADRDRIPAVAHAVADAGADVFVGDDEVRKLITQLGKPQPIVALFHRPPRPSARELMTGSRRLVIVEGVDNPVNVGSIVRNAAALGWDGLVLDHTSADPLSRRSLRVAMGTAFSLPHARTTTLIDELEALASDDLEVFGLTPDASATDIRSVRPSGRRAVMIGAERSGLSDAALSVTTPVRIPMADGVDSLNAASATAIGCYALG